jgi:hypothetical protein
LSSEATPVSDGKRRREAGDARREVIFPRANRSLRWIRSMHVGRCVLYFDLLGRDESFDVT